MGHIFKKASCTCDCYTLSVWISVDKSRYNALVNSYLLWPPLTRADAKHLMLSLTGLCCSSASRGNIWCQCSGEILFSSLPLRLGCMRGHRSLHTSVLEKITEPWPLFPCRPSTPTSLWMSSNMAPWWMSMQSWPFSSYPSPPKAQVRAFCSYSSSIIMSMTDCEPWQRWQMDWTACVLLFSLYSSALWTAKWLILSYWVFLFYLR